MNAPLPAQAADAAERASRQAEVVAALRGVLPAHALAEGFAFRFPTLERALDDLLRP